MQVDVRLEIDQPVYDTDGELVARVAGVVAPPSLQRVTHVILSDRDEQGTRLVPVDDLHDEGGDLLLEDEGWPDAYDPAEELDLIALDEQIQQDLALAFPLGDVWMFPNLALPGGHRRLIREHLPSGEVAITSGSRVHATDGAAGRLVGLLLDPAGDEPTHLLVRHGHLWRRRALAVPIGLVERVEGSDVLVAATRDELAEHVVRR